MRTSICLRLASNGQVEALVPIPETGTGSHTVAQRVIARALEIATERVSVRYVATDQLPFDFGVGGQLVTGSVVNVCVEAARLFLAELHAAGLDLAEPRVDWPPIEVTTEAGEASLHEGGAITYAVQVADVDVDVETGQVYVVDFVSAHDVAEIIDPVSHRGQIDGGFAMGLGFALSEDLSIVDGRVTASHLGEYKLPTSADMPPLRVVLLAGGQGVGPLNTKAIGEMGNVGVAPAIANAVSDALGTCMDSLPLTAERVLKASARWG
jgi:CO/xanthine dehydrogenase Mo-binding subunit